METQNTSRDAEAPFNPEISPKPDAIIRSGDGTDFFIHRTIVSLASSFFHHLLTDGTPEILRDGLPVICVPESSATLRHLLIFCYPFSADFPQAVHSWDEVNTLASAANKYCMQGVESHIRSCVLLSTTLIRRDPLLAYATGIQWNWPDIVQKAARESLGQDVCDALAGAKSELPKISGLDVYSLMCYHRACKAALLQLPRQTRRLADPIQPDEEDYIWYPFLDRNQIWAMQKRCYNNSCPKTWVYCTKGEPSDVISDGYPTHSWMIGFINSLSFSNPGSSIRQEGRENIEGLLKQVLMCPSHRDSAFEDVNKFLDLLSQGISSALDEVQFQLESADGA